MSHVQLSDVQLTNLTLLLTIRDGIHLDRLAACCRFGLDAAQAERFGSLGIQQIMAMSETRSEDAWLWNVAGGAEVDLVIDRPEGRIGFEIKHADQIRLNHQTVHTPGNNRFTNDRSERYFGARLRAKKYLPFRMLNHAADTGDDGFIIDRGIAVIAR